MLLLCKRFSHAWNGIYISFSLTSISGNMELNSGVTLLKMLFESSAFLGRKMFGLTLSSKEVRVIRLASLSDLAYECVVI